MILSVILLSMSGMTFGHYGMTLVPAVVYPISLIFTDLEKLRLDSKKAVVLTISVYLISAILILPKWGITIAGIPKKFETRNENHINDTTNCIVRIIEDHTEKEDKIAVYGNWDIIYVLSNRIHATKYSYQFPIGQVMPEIMDEYISELQKEQPKAIVVQSVHYDDNIKKVLHDNYELKFSSNDEDLTKSAMLYLRKGI